jgi:drug/metabolite transporter (DMT)-like permease
VTLPAPPRRPVALALMICAPLLWSIAGVLMRGIERAGAFEMAFWRSTFAALFVATALAILHGAAGIRRALRAAVSPVGLVSGLMWAIMFTAFMVALTLTTTANVLVTNCIGVLLTALLAWLVLREPVSARTWVAIALATAGMAVMFGGGLQAGDARHLSGMLIALSIPVASAINIIVLRHSAARIDLMPAVLLGAFISAAVTLPWALPFAATPRDFAVLAGLGVFQLGLPCMLLVFASRTLRAPEIALLGLLEVVLGPLWAWLGADEVPAGATLAGGAVILAAVAGNQLWSLLGNSAALRQSDHR